MNHGPFLRHRFQTGPTLGHPPIQCHHSIPSALRRSQDAARPINRTTKAALSANYRSMQPKSCYGRMSRFFVENIDRALRQPNFRATTNIMHLAKRDENAFYFNRTSRAWHDPCAAHMGSKWRAPVDLEYDLEEVIHTKAQGIPLLSSLCQELS